MNKMSSISANQLNKILSYLDEEQKKNIPLNVWEQINLKVDNSYETKIDSVDDINEKNILPETRKYLAFIFLNYLATKEEKEEYQKIIKHNEEEYQEYLREKYDVEKIFNSRKVNINIDNEIQEESTALVVKKENLFIIILNKIKRLFKK